MDGEISADEVASLLDTDQAPTVVDIRQPAAFDRGHIPGSLNVPLPELPRRVEDLSGADHVVTVCPHGKSSVQAARLIGSHEATADARVESMAGGLTEYEGDLESEARNPAPVDRGQQPRSERDARRPANRDQADEGPDAPF